MPLISKSLECQIANSFRVQQVAGMFDLPAAQTLRESFAVEVPSLEEPWLIGAIVGPSGSGKSTIARAAFGEHCYTPGDWPADRAVIDGFGELPIKLVTQTLTAVGLGSPPSWLKPYRVLSTGEKFRCELARALLESRESRDERREPEGSESGSRLSALDSRLSSDSRLVVFDEFTSVVDRHVARIASAAVARAIRKGHVRTRLVVVSCHSDILEWLEPDWVVEMATRTLSRGCLRRPPIELRIIPAKHRAWAMFAKHHYLSGALSRAASVYVAAWNETPVALCAVVALYGHAGRRRIHRLVTLPDFQGIGIGSRLLDTVAQWETARGHRVNITTSHPAVIAHCRGSPCWRAVSLHRAGTSSKQQKDGRAVRSARGRATVSFEFTS